MSDEGNTQSHYVNLAGVTVPGMYAAKIETRAGTEYRIVRVDMTMFGNGLQQMRMFSGIDGTEIPALVSDSATYFGPLPLE